MLPELVILRYLLTFGHWQKYGPELEISKDYREINILFNTLAKMHTSMPDTDKTVDELEAMVLAYYPGMAKSERTGINTLCDQLRSTEVSDAVARELMDQIASRSAARDLALAALDFAEGRGTKDKIQELASTVVETHESATEHNERCWVTSDLKELREATIAKGGLYWPLKSLNLSLGPLRKGDFGFVFARPETGKTTFLSHAATHMAGQAEGPVVWFNNEEQGSKVRVRTYQSALGVTTPELFKDVDDNEKRYRAFTKDNIKLYDDASIHRGDVESIIRELKPSLLIFDQIDKIRGFDADRPDLVFGRVYQWAREISKIHCPVIGTCQSDGTGEGVKWLTMSHVAEAKTSKQAEADWILGIGKSNEGGTEDVRFFNISKNKLMGDEQTDPELRHGRFDVWIRPQIARYEDVI